MKTSNIIVALMAFGIVGVQAQISTSANQSVQTTIPAPTAYRVVDSDSDSRVWQRETYERGAGGRIIAHVHKYQELATGLNHLVNGEWVESKEEIDILPNGTAAAVNGRHQAYFPGDIYHGQIELVTPDGKHLRSRPLGLSYFDGQNSVLIAELKSSVGIVVGSNQVVYPDAFTDFKADLRYTYTKAGFEQDIILRQQPPTPDSVGLNPATARLEVLTEFFSPPQPAIQSKQMASQAGLALTDQSLDFGSMQMIPGRAFTLGNNTKDAGAKVSKSWVLLDGRQFLVEEVPVDAILKGLAALPLTAKVSGSSKTLHTASKHLALPPQRPAKHNPAQPTMLAQAELPAPGFVLDYQTISGSLTNYTFQGDTTYYVSGSMFLYGSNTFEGGTVIKFNNSPLTFINDLTTTNPVICGTSPYRPAIFTAMDDDSVGEAIIGSTGNPTYAGYGTYLDSRYNDFYEVDNMFLNNMRFSYATIAIAFAGNNATLRDCQLVKCGDGVSGDMDGNVFFNNVLAVQCAHLSEDNASLYGEQLTLDGCSVLSNNGFGSLTNSIITGCGGTGSFTFHNCFVTNSSAGVYQTVGGGSYYLATNSSYRNAGATNIDPAVLADIATKTTYPPIVYSNVTISVATTLSPQAQRDTDTPDLGYHYDPLDYVVGNVQLNATLTLTNGVAIAAFQDVDPYHAPGFVSYNNINLVMAGTPQVHNQLCTYQAVQEQPIQWGSQPLSVGSLIYLAAGKLDARFVDFNGLSGLGYLVYGDYVGMNVLNCQAGPGSFNYYVDDSAVTNQFNNNLFERVNLVTGGTEGNGAQVFGNNLVRFSSLLFLKSTTGNPLVVRDNLFDDTVIIESIYYAASVTNHHNAYLNSTQTNSYTGLATPMGTGDIVLTNFIYAVGPLGNYYQPTNSPLVNAGSTTADQVGLFCFTTQTNQMLEANSIVDIGYHYMALDVTGNPVDSDGDGVPNWMDVDPNNPNVGILTVIIDSPANGSNLTQ